MSGPDNSSSAPAETMRSVNMTPRWRMHVGLHGCLGGRTPTQETEGVVSQNVVAIAFNNDVANAGGTTWVPGSNPGGSAIRGHSSAVEQCFPNFCRRIGVKDEQKVFQIDNLCYDSQAANAGGTT